MPEAEHQFVMPVKGHVMGTLHHHWLNYKVDLDMLGIANSVERVAVAAKQYVLFVYNSALHCSLGRWHLPLPAHSQVCQLHSTDDHRGGAEPVRGRPDGLAPPGTPSPTLVHRSPTTGRACPARGA